MDVAWAFYNPPDPAELEAFIQQLQQQQVNAGWGPPYTSGHSCIGAALNSG